MKIETFLSEDGSSSLYLPQLDETYHSRNGAITESDYVYIQQGLAQIDLEQISILEFGFGTGLNALLSLKFANEQHKILHYLSVEKFPLTLDIMAQINYGQQLSMISEWEELSSSEWGTWKEWNKKHRLYKLEGDFLKVQIMPETIDLVYYDAFAPSKQAEVWQHDYLQLVYDALKPGGIMVTYCAQGQFKRNLKAIGFQVEVLKGPPGKMEMVRAKK